MEIKSPVCGRIRRSVAVLSVAVVTLIVFPAHAGDLDSAWKFWQLTNIQLGSDSTIQAIDTMVNSGSILLAVNSCIRDWAIAVGIKGYQAIDLSASTFQYKLNDAFIVNGATNIPWQFKCISADGKRTWGLSEQSDPNDFGSLTDPGLPPRRYSLDGDTVWVVPMGSDGDGAVLRVTGPVRGLTMTSSSDTTNVPDEDRSAICDCATARVGWSVAFVNADQYWAKFLAYVRSRGGNAEMIQGGQ